MKKIVIIRTSMLITDFSFKIAYFPNKIVENVYFLLRKYNRIFSFLSTSTAFKIHYTHLTPKHNIYIQNDFKNFPNHIIIPSHK